MKLNLHKPIIFFDLETTGIDPSRDRIVEISILKVMPDGSEEIKTRRINPEMPIPKQASDVHGIKNEDVKDCPPFKQVAKSLYNWIEGCDIAGFNSNKFDVPVLVEEFLRAGVEVDFSDRQLVDVQTIFHKMERRTLQAAYKFYCDEVLTDAHSAEADAKATYEVLKAQLDKYPEDLQNDIAFLGKFSQQHQNVDFAGRMVYNEKSEAIFNFGRYRGRRVVDVLTEDPGYYGWMIGGDFPLDTKNCLTRIHLKSSQK